MDPSNPKRQLSSLKFKASYPKHLEAPSETKLKRDLKKQIALKEAELSRMIASASQVASRVSSKRVSSRRAKNENSTIAKKVQVE